MIHTTNSLAWQKRRSDFNHDWLQNNFIVTLSDWSKSIKRGNWGACTQELFLEEIVSEWEVHNDQLLSLLADYENHMSPRAFVEDSLIIENRDLQYQHFLGELMHNLWLVRYDVSTKTRKVSDAYATAHQGYMDLKATFPNALGMQDKEHLTRLFDKFKSSCLILRKRLHPLESSIRVT
jgi:hypothetical protein